MPETRPTLAPHRSRSLTHRCRRAGRVGIALALIVPAPVAVLAQEDPCDACVGLDDAAARLACYDRLHGRDPEPDGTPASGEIPQRRDDAASASPVTPATPVPAPAPREPRAGTSRPRDDDSASGSGASPEGGPLRIVATGTLPTGRRWFRLEDDSLWEQMTMRRSRLDVDDVVQVKESMIGTWHMRPADGKGRSTQVRRSN